MLSELTLKQLAEARSVLLAGGLIAYPTEAVFGLGCDPDNPQAVVRLLALKQRPVEKGLILVAANYQQLLPYVDDQALPADRRQTIFASWPGPVTWVMPARSSVPNWLTGDFDAIAVRVSAHPDVAALCLAFGKPLVSTSANLSGYPPARDVDEVRLQFGERVHIVYGHTQGRSSPSTIRDALSGHLYRH